MHNEFNDVKHRINRVDSAIAGIRRDEAGTAEDIAHQQAAIDRLKDRFDRIELAWSWSTTFKSRRSGLAQRNPTYGLSTACQLDIGLAATGTAVLPYRSGFREAHLSQAKTRKEARATASRRRGNSRRHSLGRSAERGAGGAEHAEGTNAGRRRHHPPRRSTR